MTHFGGIRPELVETFLERVELEPGAKSNGARSNRGGNMSGEVVQAFERWKELERQGWDVTALASVDGSHLIGLGCRYAGGELEPAGAVG